MHLPFSRPMPERRCQPSRALSFRTRAVSRSACRPPLPSPPLPPFSKTPPLMPTVHVCALRGDRGRGLGSHLLRLLLLFNFPATCSRPHYARAFASRSSARPRTLPASAAGLLTRSGSISYVVRTAAAPPPRTTLFATPWPPLQQRPAFVSAVSNATSYPAPVRLELTGAWAFSSPTMLEAAPLETSLSLTRRAPGWGSTTFVIPF